MNSAVLHDQRRFDRRALLTLVFVLSFALLCASVGAWQLGRVGDGCQFVAEGFDAPKPIQNCYGSWPTPLQSGDRIVAVEGIPLGDTDDLVFTARPLPPGWVDDGTVRYEVLRDGRLLMLAVPLGRLGAFNILHVYWNALIGQFFDFILPIFVGSLVIFGLAPRSNGAQLMLIATGPLFAMTTFTWASETVAAGLALGPIAILNIVIATLWGWLFVPTLLLLVLSFPRRVWPISRWPRGVAVLLYALPAGSLALAFVTQRFELFIAVLGISALTVIGCAVGITLHTLIQERDPVLRAQSAWLALGLSVGFAFWPLFWAITEVFPSVNDMLSRLPRWIDAILNLVFGMVFPLSMGIAITRYRLFDIDVIIRRTLVYGLLSTALVLVYGGSVVLLQALLRPLVGAESQLAIIASTLLIATLFGPLRRRVQQVIDRRFFRRKYDAAKTVERFNRRLRDETDVQTLIIDMARIVDDTVRPAHLSLWIKPIDHEVRR